MSSISKILAYITELLYVLWACVSVLKGVPAEPDVEAVVVPYAPLDLSSPARSQESGIVSPRTSPQNNQANGPGERSSALASGLCQQLTSLQMHRCRHRLLPLACLRQARQPHQVRRRKHSTFRQRSPSPMLWGCPRSSYLLSALKLQALPCKRPSPATRILISTNYTPSLSSSTHSVIPSPQDTTSGPFGTRGDSYYADDALPSPNVLASLYDFSMYDTISHHKRSSQLTRANKKNDTTCVTLTHVIESEDPTGRAVQLPETNEIGTLPLSTNTQCHPTITTTERVQHSESPAERVRPVSTLRTLLLPQEVARRNSAEFRSSPSRGPRPLLLPLQVAKRASTASISSLSSVSIIPPTRPYYTTRTSNRPSASWTPYSSKHHDLCKEPSATEKRRSLDQIISLLDASGITGPAGGSADLGSTATVTSHVGPADPICKSASQLAGSQANRNQGVGSGPATDSRLTRQIEQIIKLLGDGGQAPQTGNLNEPHDDVEGTCIYAI